MTETIVRLKKPHGCDCTTCGTARPKRRRRAAFAPKSILLTRVPVRDGGWDGTAWCDEHAPKGADVIDEEKLK